MQILIYGLGHVGLAAAGCLTMEGRPSETRLGQTPGYACARLLKANRQAGVHAVGFAPAAAGA